VPFEPLALPVLDPVLLAWLKGLLIGCGFGIALSLAAFEIAERKWWGK